MRTLEGKRAIVAGGGTGIGRGIALALAAAGARVCLSYNASSAGAADAATEIRAAGGQVWTFAADLAQGNAGADFVAAACAEMQGIDMLVYNAGLSLERAFLEVTPEEWDRVHNVNLRSAFFCAQAAARQMCEQGGGKIIFIGSVHGSASVPKFSAYAASKGGVDALTRQLAVELAPWHINVNAVIPGLIEVESYYQAFPWYDRVASGRQVPLGRVGFPADIAAAVTFLASDAADFVTGHALVVDGGQLAKLAIDRPGLD
jgi:NAD(P)-dependent dehydrogenase (short-subunit alcohol dehydrogenase family)